MCDTPAILNLHLL